MRLLNPKRLGELPLDARSREIVEKTIAFFEAKGKGRLRQDDLDRVWYADFLEFVKRERIFADLLTPPELGGPDARWDTFRNCFVNEVLGFKFKIVRGYQGTPQINLAIERGEVQGMGGLGWASVKAQTPHWISERKIRVLAQYGFKRYAELADVPTMFELARSDADRQAMTMLFARTEYGRPYFLPPDVPVERVAALRRAFDATMIDPAFLAEATRLQFDVDPLTGEQVQALVGELAATPREVVARVRAALEAPAAQ